MALVLNGIRTLAGPAQHRNGASALVFERTNFQRGGSIRNFHLGEATGTTEATGGFPNGAEGSDSWSLPRKSGGLASYTAITGFGNLVAGDLQPIFLIAGTMAGSGDLTGAMSLLSGMAANLVGNGNITTALQLLSKLEASISGAGDINASLGMIVAISSVLSGSGTLDASNLTGIGSLVANIRGYGDLTPEGIRDSVWAAALTAINVPGTAGAAVQAAGGGGGSSDPTIGEPLLYSVDTNTTVADPGHGDVRWNNATQNAATVLAISHITDDGLDISAFFGRLAAGDYLRVQDKDDAARFQNWLITSTTNNVDWLELGVSIVTSGGGNLPNNHQIVLVASYPASASSDPWATLLPGAYGAGTAGNILGNLLAAIGTRLIENGLSQDEVTRIMLGALAGQRVGLGTATERYKSQDGTKDRIVLTPDPNGNGDPVVDGT